MSKAFFHLPRSVRVYRISRPLRDLQPEHPPNGVTLDLGGAFTDLPECYYGSRRRIRTKPGETKLKAPTISSPRFWIAVLTMSAFRSGETRQ
jgi:hypothetical protein